MKIKISNMNKKQLEDLKVLIDEILNTNFEDMDLNEANLKKIKNLKQKADMIANIQYRYRGLDIKIVNSDGTELTTII